MNHPIYIYIYIYIYMYIYIAPYDPMKCLVLPQEEMELET